jgi:serine O-acetyltransferase
MNPLFETILADLRRPVEVDPAARGYADVILSYPGFHALLAHRLIHPLYVAGIPLLPRFLANVTRFITGVEINPGAKIGKGCFIDHGMGVVIGETAELGDFVSLNQGVTLGGTSRERVKRHPTLEDNVIVGASALVIGAITIGRNAKIGAGTVVVRDVPPNATIVGIPGRVVLQDGKPVPGVRAVPEVADANTALVAQLTERVQTLERRLAALERDDGAHGDATAAL